jgi:hypothetical protein
MGPNRYDGRPPTLAADRLVRPMPSKAGAACRTPGPDLAGRIAALAARAGQRLPLFAERRQK